MLEGERIVRINIDEEMKSSYIDYSMSVIVARALPDVRDGLKPVHRRVLFGMNELGVGANRPYKKSARIVGEVLGKYHPHGDSSVYMAMVRMAQNWSMRYPLIEGQGNFGSIDGDSPAAMRYTEARLQKLAEETMSDIDKGTVDFQLNFDDSLEEPTVLPTRIPNLLVNGSSGIAVGMATNMPPHNLTESVNAIIAVIENPEITIEGLLKYIKAPDFPTGGIIYGYQGVKEAFETGRGRIVVRGKATIETLPNGRERIIITEIPYMVNKAEMIIKTADLINDKKIEGISNVNDESDRTGMRIVYDLKKDAIANVVLNNLYKYTPLQTAFSVNNIALVHGRPRMLNLRDMIDNFIAHRLDVVTRRTRYDLEQAEKKAHVLEGLLIALDHLDAVITLIRNSKTPDEAKSGLMENFGLSEIQSKAILELRLQRLTGLERDKIRQEYDELMALITWLKQLLEDQGLRMNVIKDELIEVREKFGDERRTEIVYASEDFNPEDFYADDDMVITISHMGYIKRTPLTEFRTQTRGGVGSKGSTTRDEDFIEHLYVASMHNTIILFTESGRCFWLKVYEIPEGTRISKGRAIQNLLNIEQEDKVKAYLRVKDLNDEEFINNNYIILCTKKGVIKKTLLEAYSRPRQNGVNAITVKEGDQLLEARMTSGGHEILMAVRSGKAIRFHESTVRAVGRTASGVRGISLSGKNDEVVGMICIEQQNEDILVVSENGYGKRSSIQDYRITNRGGKGVKTINVTDKTGNLIGIMSVTDDDDLMIINRSGITIRMVVSQLRIQGRATQGVRLINLRENDSIASVAKVDNEGAGEAGPDFLDMEGDDNEQNGQIDTE
ncbi:MAG: DNA gyrase subunit A [Bacteroidetes bacterium GWF2_49_14]|nr:MAG: DNA gyrase subunit A [Bacteroidetes bacterium GWF2_49_14]HBB90847.1 DNA gyrase subunit A [Bacteroidales bacterium]